MSAAAEQDEVGKGLGRGESLHDRVDVVPGARPLEVLRELPGASAWVGCHGPVRRGEAFFVVREEVGHSEVEADKPVLMGGEHLADAVG